MNLDFFRRQYDRFVAIPRARRKLRQIHILSSEESIRYIIDHRCSVSRYGDGEFGVMMGEGNGFQHPDERLAERLKQVITATDAPNHVVGLPLPLKRSSMLRRSSHDFWRYFALRHADELLPWFSRDRKYLDTQLSRFYITYKDKSHCARQLALLKQIWNDRDVVIVEGTQSRTGVGNDLYTNARTIGRILCPATDAFSRYDDLLAAVLQYASRDKLLLLSCGMTATVLAYDLAKAGYWAIDIGHLDVEYEWFLAKATDNIPITGKFVNEVKQGGHNVKDCSDKTYLQQIIFDITRDST